MIVVLAQPFQYVKALTPSDTGGLLYGAVAIKNTGTSGSFVVRQDTADATVTEYLRQGDSIPVGQHQIGVNLTALGAGVTLLAYY